MEKSAILFGSIGTLVETSAMQRAAFNKAFAEAGLDWEWGEKEYIQMLQKPGGRARIADYAKQRGESVSASELHSRKTAIFGEMLAEEGISPRPGVLSLIRFAKDEGLKLGFATTTSVNNVQAIFNALNGILQRSTFDFVGTSDMVSAGKPDPEIYERAMTELDVSARACLAIEDTPSSLKAAREAGIDCIAFPGAYVKPQDFSDAYRVVEKLDPALFPVLA
ncbi:MAG: HAD-IA family hydrolase [Pseudomonadota bacterium]